MVREQPRLTHAGLRPGDEFAHPFGTFDVLDVRGGVGGDKKEWYVRDADTGEELWVDDDILIRLTFARVHTWVPHDDADVDDAETGAR